MIYLLSHTITDSARRFPDRAAFRFGKVSLTYREMEQRMNQLAGVLHTLNIKKGDRIGIYLNRSIETAIAIFGILQAGGVYVPIDPKAPITRSQFLIEDCEIEILITQPVQGKKVSQIIKDKNNIRTVIGLPETEGVKTISWESVFAASAAFDLPFRILEKDLAYIIYTSGSTGQPKGIMHTHYSGLSYARLTAELYQITEQDRIGNHAPIHFDISTLGYFTSPLVGACTVIASDAVTVFPATLGKLIAEEALTIWYSVPLALIQILQNGVLADQALPHLRWVLYAGEPFPPKYLRTLMQQWSATRFSNVYGPTETNACTYYHLPEIPITDDPIPIGQVWKNTDYLILDEEGKEAAPGMTGELLICSATQMLGYWRNPALTEKSLHSVLAATGQASAFYKTGDLVKEEDGILHFLGRKDFQVKIRGHRVELGAIEACLVAHASVREAAVYTVRIAEESLKIVAAVILAADSEESVNNLLYFLKEKLPLYAVPEEIKIVKDFPRTSSGKIKRGALVAAL